MGFTSSAGFRDSGPEASVNSFAEKSALAEVGPVHITDHIRPQWGEVGFHLLRAIHIPATAWTAEATSPVQRPLHRTWSAVTELRLWRFDLALAIAVA
jgi:hypothetical protein